VQSFTPGVGRGIFNGAGATAASGGAGTYFNANAIGNYITYTVPVAKPGTYQVRVGIQTRSNKGKFQLAINGLNVGQRQDEYNPSVTYVARDVGVVALTTAGNYAFKFTVTGKNASSSGYTLAFDYIELIPTTRFETELLNVQSKTPPPTGVSPAKWFGVFNGRRKCGKRPSRHIFQRQCNRQLHHLHRARCEPWDLPGPSRDPNKIE